MLPKTKRVFDALTALQALLHDFILVGGTALSIREDHRLSEDLDFYCRRDKLDRRAISAIIFGLSAVGFKVNKSENVARAQEFLNAGDDIDDFQQDFVVDDVKVTFFHPFGAMEKPFESDTTFSAIDGINVATAEALFESKALLIDERTKIRDHFDLYWLCKHKHKTFDDIVSVYRRHKNHIGPDHIERKLVKVVFRSDDEPIDGMTRETISADEIRAYFQSLIADYQIALAGQIFEEDDYVSGP